MKERIRKLLIAAVTLAAIHQLQAVTIFPIATNSAGTNLNGYGAGCGSNYFIVFINDDEAAFQIVYTNGTVPDSGITDFGITSELPKAVYAGTNYLALYYSYIGKYWHAEPFTTSGVEINSGTNLGSAQSNGLAVLLTDGTNALAAWQTNGGAAYYGQFLTSAAALSGSTFPIVVGSSNLAGAYGATNYFFIWQIINGESEYNTFGAFVSKSGSVGTPFQISVTASLDQSPPAVAFDGTNFLALWNTDTTRNASNAPIWNLYGRLVTQSGGFASGETLLNTNQPSYPYASFDGTNYLVSWSYDLSSTNSDKQLLFQFYNRSLSPVASPFTVFPVMGTNMPLFGGANFDGHKYVAVCTIGTDTVSTNGNIETFPSGSIYGAFLSTQPTLAASNYSGTQFSGILTGTPGFTYAIQYVTNITSTNWTPLVTNTNGTFSFTDSNATNKARFYRAEQQ